MEYVNLYIEKIIVLVLYNDKYCHTKDPLPGLPKQLDKHLLHIYPQDAEILILSVMMLR